MPGLKSREHADLVLLCPTARAGGQRWLLRAFLLPACVTASGGASPLCCCAAVGERPAPRPPPHAASQLTPPRSRLGADLRGAGGNNTDFFICFEVWRGTLRNETRSAFGRIQLRLPPAHFNCLMNSTPSPASAATCETDHWMQEGIFLISLFLLTYSLLKPQVIPCNEPWVRVWLLPRDVFQ